MSRRHIGSSQAPACTPDAEIPLTGNTWYLPCYGKTIKTKNNNTIAVSRTNKFQWFKVHKLDVSCRSSFSRGRTIPTPLRYVRLNWSRYMYFHISCFCDLFLMICLWGSVFCSLITRSSFITLNTICSGCLSRETRLCRIIFRCWFWTIIGMHGRQPAQCRNVDFCDNWLQVQRSISLSLGRGSILTWSPEYKAGSSPAALLSW